MNATDLATLLTHHERPDLEYKGPVPFTGNFRPHLTATIAAMANHPGGGTIIIGVTDHDEPTGLTTDDLATYDATRLREYLDRFLDPLPQLTLQTITLHDKRLLIITVTEYTDTPIVVTKTLQDTTGKTYAREADLLIRSATCTTRRAQTNDELRALLRRATNPATPPRDNAPTPFLTHLLASSLPNGIMSIIDTDQEPAWVRSGTIDWRFPDPSITAGFLDALTTAQQTGLVRQSRGTSYELTSNGFTTARRAATTHPVPSLHDAQQKLLQFLANHHPRSFTSTELTTNLGDHDQITSANLRTLHDHQLVDPVTGPGGSSYRATINGLATSKRAHLT